MLNDIIIINSTISTHDSLTHGSTHSEDSEANKTNKHISLRGDPVSDDLCFFHSKVSLGPCEICEQACHLATEQQHGNSSQTFQYLDSIYMLWVYIIHSLVCNSSHIIITAVDRGGTALQHQGRNMENKICAERQN